MYMGDGVKIIKASDDTFVLQFRTQEGEDGTENPMKSKISDEKTMTAKTKKELYGLLDKILPTLYCGNMPETEYVRAFKEEDD